MWLHTLPICRNPLAVLLFCAAAVSGCAHFPDYRHQTPQPHLSAPADSPLWQWSQSLAAEHPQQSGVALLSEGTDAFLARLLLVLNASASLDLQYYLYHDDLTGKALARALLSAADRGVRVRLLLDDMATRDTDDYLRFLNRHPNIHIRLFNPFRRDYPRDMQFVTRYGISTRRMHNKSMVADNSLAIVGGRNIGDEYFDAARNAVVFGDLDVLTTGPVVDDISSEFDRYWNSPLSVPVEYQLQDKPPAADNALVSLRSELDEWLHSHQDHPYGRALQARAESLAQRFVPGMSWGKAYVVADEPDKVTRQRYASPVLGNVGLLMQNAHHEVILISPYFVPGDSGVEHLTALVARGVRVVVLTNSLASTDVPAVHSAYKHYREALLRGGVELYELRPEAGQQAKKSWTGSSSSSLHAKALLIDQRYFYVGSMNFDPRSVTQNTEMGVLFDQPELGRQMSDSLLTELTAGSYRLQLDDGRLVWLAGDKRYQRDPDASLWRRLQSWVLGVLPIESEL